jgi:quercetin dioxygenase-like cupin family protein
MQRQPSFKDFPMPFYRFEGFESHYLTPHLSTGKAPVIEGRYMYFCLIHKDGGTGSELHYHPNELLIFPLRGKINALVGKDRRIVSPGTFVHAPAYAGHSMKATEDGPAEYLYIKDRTWTVVGLAADEAVPDRAMSVAEVNRLYKEGKLEQRKSEPEKSQIIIEGMNNCYYPILDSLDAPAWSARRVTWIEGERLAFGFFEVRAGYGEPGLKSEHEQFIYVIGGKLKADVDGESKDVGTGDIIHIPKGAIYRLSVQSRQNARYALVHSTPYLENRIDSMTEEEAELARREVKPN